jgi:hypothetical protein
VGFDQVQDVCGEPSGDAHFIDFGLIFYTYGHDG